MKGPVVAIMGPTASGKSSLALALAERLGGEILSADSAQVYRGLDVGTAKPTPQERARIPHHLLDLRDPDQGFSLADFLRLAGPALEEIQTRGRLPLLVGGTGLYLRGLLEGYTLVEVPPNPELRARLEALQTEVLLTDLQARDPETAERVDPRNRRRLIRALEVCIQTGRAFSEISRRVPPEHPRLKLGLRVPRAVLTERIDRRLEAMVESGWVEEVRFLVEKGWGPCLRHLRILGYREILDVVEGQRPLQEALEEIRLATRRYARRQETWLRAEPGLEWIDFSPDSLRVAEARILRFLEEEGGEDPLVQPAPGLRDRTASWDGPQDPPAERRNPPCS